MADCLFCRIVAGKIPCQKVFENERVFAFRDINPQAPVHVLVVPKKHGGDVPECGDPALLGELLLTAADLARSLGVAESGYRIVINTGRDSGQAVDHLHVHLIGGRPMHWPPG